MTTIRTLASGSSGNAALLSCGETHLLIDMGISCRKVCRSLASLGLTPEALGGVLITHEHTDHVQGVARLAYKYSLPVYATPKTWGSLSEVPTYLQNDYSYGLQLGDFVLDFCKTSHDAVQPVGLVLQAEGKRLAYITDTGCVTRGMLAAMAAEPLDGVVLEANHDRQMLLQGPYPYALKRRVASEQGHLTNAQAAELLAWLWQRQGVCPVLLAHLSETNNAPQLAYDTVAAALCRQISAAELPQWLSVAPALGQSRVLQFD